jgi:hypothetical protein
VISARTFPDIVLYFPSLPHRECIYKRLDNGRMKAIRPLYWVVEYIDKVVETPCALPSSLPSTDANLPMQRGGLFYLQARCRHPRDNLRGHDQVESPRLLPRAWKFLRRVLTYICTRVCLVFFQFLSCRLYL